MSTPGGVVATTQGTTKTVEPSAVSDGQSSAVFALGQVLKTVLHKMPIFSVESDLDNAINVVDKWVSAFVPGSAMAALVTGDERAPKEDVSQRIPPGGPVANIYSGPQLDYAKLAQAILAAQKEQGQVTNGS